MSTAVMRSFGSRNDTTLIDEPFYGYYLAQSGEDRPFRNQIIASKGQDWEQIVCTLTHARSEKILFQKHMAHHVRNMPSLDWIAGLTNFILIRDPLLIASSYFERTGRISVSSTALPDLVKIFDLVSEIAGSQPVVVDANRLLASPRKQLLQLCNSIDISFDDAMLSWEVGRKETDGVWADHWYQSVRESSGFRPLAAKSVPTNAEVIEAAEQARPFYDYLLEHAQV